MACWYDEKYSCWQPQLPIYRDLQTRWDGYRASKYNLLQTHNGYPLTKACEANQRVSLDHSRRRQESDDWGLVEVLTIGQSLSFHLIVFKCKESVIAKCKKIKYWVNNCPPTVVTEVPKSQSVSPLLGHKWNLAPCSSCPIWTGQKTPPAINYTTRSLFNMNVQLLAPLAVLLE